MCPCIDRPDWLGGYAEKIGAGYGFIVGVLRIAETVESLDDHPVEKRAALGGGGSRELRLGAYSRVRRRPEWLAQEPQILVIPTHQRPHHRRHELPLERPLYWCGKKDVVHKRHY